MCRVEREMLKEILCTREMQVRYPKLIGSGSTKAFDTGMAPVDSVSFWASANEWKLCDRWPKKPKGTN